MINIKDKSFYFLYRTSSLDSSQGIIILTIRTRFSFAFIFALTFQPINKFNSIVVQIYIVAVFLALNNTGLMCDLIHFFFIKLNIINCFQCFTFTPWN